MPAKSLDTKIARILADPSVGDFILADAKDADHAGGMASGGPSPEAHAGEAKYRTMEQYRQEMRQNVAQGLLDIMLMSASTSEVLTIKERLFENNHITPACRANDTTDIWLVQGGVYASEPSRPFRSATIDHIMCGKVNCTPAERATGTRVGADLGLYSMTFNNDLDHDEASLNAYREFRIEAEKKGFRHFLEVFAPNACGDHCPPDMGRFINDMIGRCLAGVVGKGRPIFLKIPFVSPAQMEQLASYDRTIIPGILGGASGTTFDAFDQLIQAKKYGARAALYGRMINHSEHQRAFIQHLRWIADGQTTDAGEAVKSYHAALEKLGVKPKRALADDLASTRRGSSYGASSGGAATAAPASAPAASPAKPAAPAWDPNPDFSKMTQSEKIAWNLAKWNRVLK